MEKFPDIITMEWLVEYLDKNVLNKVHIAKVLERFKEMGDVPKFRRLLHLRPRFSKGDGIPTLGKYGNKRGRKSNKELIKKDCSSSATGNVVKDYLMARHVERTENGGYVRKGERYRLLLDTMYDDVVKNKNVTAAKFLFDNAFRVPKADGRRKQVIDNDDSEEEEALDSILKNANINPLLKINKDITE